MSKLYAQLYKEAALGNCTFRKYAAAVVTHNKIIGIGHARTVDGKECKNCERLKKIGQYGKVSEFFEDCNVIHAEVCAILDCRNKEKLKEAELYLLGICCNDGGSIYQKAFPCPNCLKIIQYVGITAVNVYLNEFTWKRYEV